MSVGSFFYAPDDVVKATKQLSLFVPFLQSHSLAIPISVKARVLKMAALYDLNLTLKMLETEIFNPVLQLLPGRQDARDEINELNAKVCDELTNNVAETPANQDGVTPTPEAAPTFGT